MSRPVRWRTAVAAAVVLVTAGCASGSPRPTSGRQTPLATLRVAAAMQPCPGGAGLALPELVLPCLSGGPDVTLRAPGTGTPLLVNVWATWCGPCVREVPDLVAFARDAAGKVDMLGVLTEDSPRNGLEFARQFSMRYPSVVDDDGIVMRQFSPGPPVTLLLDAAGRVRYVQRGEIRSGAALRTLVRTHLGVDVPERSGGPSDRPSPSGVAP